MTLPNRWALAAGRTSKKGCHICHGPRLPGARLCAPCKAALKRARQFTVLDQISTVAERISRPSRVRAEARAAKREPKAVSAIRSEPSVLAAAQPSRVARRTRALPALVIAAAAVAAGGYLALRLARPAAEPIPAFTVPVPTSNQSGLAVLPMPRTESAAGVEVLESKPPTDASTRVAAPVPTSVAKPGRLAPKRVAEPAPVVSAPAVAAAPEPPQPAPAPVPEVAPPVQVAPAPDRWQAMADSIARCGKDGFLAGIVCEQRVRIQYCDGLWGQVAQCPSGINNDHGQ